MAFMLLALRAIASIAPVLAVLHGIHPGDEWEVVKTTPGEITYQHMFTHERPVTFPRNT